MITKDIIPIFNTDTFLEGIKSDSNVSMYEIKSPEYNSCGPFPPTPCAVVEIEDWGNFSEAILQLSAFLASSTVPCPPNNVGAESNIRNCICKISKVKDYFISHFE